MKTSNSALLASHATDAVETGTSSSDRFSLEPQVRPLRADALRNRARILEAAEEVFALEGVGVPIDVVAGRANVGVGTLYRHFPTKEALFQAIVLERLQSLVCSAQDCEREDDPGNAIFSFLHELGTQAAARRDLMEAIESSGIDIKSSCQSTIEDLVGRVEHMRQQAVTSGTIRSDVSAEEIVALVVGTCHASAKTETDYERIDRMVSIVCDGLRP
jgi:AcrR family transcriptional regulator